MDDTAACTLFAWLDRELWLKQTLGDCRRLREEGIPLIGYTWWPCLDNIDWDGAFAIAVPKVNAATSPDQYAAAVQEMLNKLGDPLTRVSKNSKSVVKAGVSHTELNDDGILLITVAGADYQNSIQAPGRRAVSQSSRRRVRFTRADLPLDRIRAERREQQAFLHARGRARNAHPGAQRLCQR